MLAKKKRRSSDNDDMIYEGIKEKESTKAATTWEENESPGK